MARTPAPGAQQTLNPVGTDMTSAATIRASPIGEYGPMLYCVSGSAISVGDVVYVSGTSATAPYGGVQVATRADADAFVSAKGNLYVAETATAGSGEQVWVSRAKRLKNVNTNSALAALDPIFPSGTAGGWAVTPGVYGDPIGMVLVKSSTVGEVILEPSRNWGGAGGLIRATATIPFTAVRTMNATPVTILAAPGAGQYIEVVGAVHWFLDYGSAAYDAAASGDTLVLKYTDASGVAITDAVAGNAIGSASADYHTWVYPVPEYIPVANAAVVAHITTGEWYSAAGDSPLKVEFYYRIRPLDL